MSDSKIESVHRILYSNICIISIYKSNCITVHCLAPSTNHKSTMLSSFHRSSLVPRPRPAFRRLHYGKARGGWNVSDCHMTATRLEFFLVSFPDQIFRRLGRATREKFGLGTRLGMLVFVVRFSVWDSLSSPGLKWLRHLIKYSRYILTLRAGVAYLLYFDLDCNFCLLGKASNQLFYSSC